MNSRSSLIAMLLLLLGLAWSGGCGTPSQPSHAPLGDQSSASLPQQSVPAAPNGGVTQTSRPDGPRVDDSAPADQRVIESALDSLELRLAARAEKDPQKRAALEKQLQQVKVARQSIYAQE